MIKSLPPSPSGVQGDKSNSNSLALYFNLLPPLALPPPSLAVATSAAVECPSAAVTISGGRGCALDALDKDAVAVAATANSPPPLPAPAKSQADTFRHRKWVSSRCLLRTSPLIQPRGWH